LLKKLGFTYLEEDDTLILSPLEPGEVTVPLPETVLQAYYEKTEEGFRVSLRTIGGNRLLKLLVLKDAGPAALILTEKIVERIACLKISWDLRDLKIEGLKLSEENVELNFITIPIREDDIRP